LRASISALSRPPDLIRMLQCGTRKRSLVRPTRGIASDGCNADEAAERYPWIVTFGFGLLHGLGFARAPLDIGLPKGDVPLALLAFNLGVEAGQLMFVAVCVVAGFLFVRFLPAIRDLSEGKRSPVMITLAYAIGGVSAYWFIERVAQF